MEKKAVYIGYSSFQYEYNKTFTLVDADIVNKDLLNHIYTRKGTRVDLNNFGTLIPDLLMEPLNGNIIQLIEDELISVFNYDPRVRLIDLKIVPYYTNNMILASATLNYIDLKLQNVLDIHLQFEI